ncbi:MAG: TRAP-type C4-dicarboxylate transport system substrate-binding protein [Psychromonas sp.]
MVTLSDLEGLKIRTMENEVHMSAFQDLGAAPTPMSFTALQQGTVDGQENSIPVITTSKLYEVQDYLTLTGHVYSSAVILMSKTSWS